MRKQKKQLLSAISVLDFAAEGKCLAKHEGQVIFIDGQSVAPGDVVDLLVKQKKKNYSEGTVQKIISYSPERVEPFCTHFGVCGGCKWQHIAYDKQLEQKWRQVYDQLVRIGHLPIKEVLPILGSESITYYRNKLEYTFSNSRWLTNDEIAQDNDFSKDALGFHVPKRFDKVLPISHCFLQPDPSNEIRLFLEKFALDSGWPFYDHVAHEGFFRNVMIRTATTGQLMVVVQFARPEMDQIEKTMAALLAEFPLITSLNYFINSKRNDSYQDLVPVCYAGNPYIEEVMEDLTFRIGVKSFYQTNPTQAYELYKVTRDLAEIKPTDLVYDLYTGTGTIAQFVSKKAKKVIGVEAVPEAIIDAKANAERNNITNCEFYVGDMKNVFNDEFINQHGQPDVIITDPPRDGMHKDVVEMLLKTGAPKIVYVSCNSATQARDLALMDEKYKVTRVRPVDMFPQTHHVENVVLLEKR